MEMTREHVDRHLLRNDLRHLIAPYYGRPLSEITIGPLLNQAFTIIRRYHMHLPPDLVLLVKTIIVTEGLGMLLDPTFRLTTVIAPYADRLMLRQYSPSRVMKKLGRAGLDTARLGVEIPQQLRRILSEIERGSFEFGMRPGSVEPLMNRFERLANRIVLGVITSAFIIGLAVLLSVYHPPGWERWSGTMFAAGFFIASVLGVYLAWSILRSGRSKRG